MLGRNSELQKATAPSQPGAERGADASVQNYSQSSNGAPSDRAQDDILAQKSGIGIHTGRQSTVTVKRSETEGLQFRFSEGEVLYECPALWARLSGTTRTTALVLRGPSRRKLQIAMIEHFMSAAHIWRLDQAYAQIETNNLGESDTVEFPILDGSALEWCTSLKATTRVPHEQAVWVVTENYEYGDGDRKISLEKSEAPTTDYSFEGVFGKIAQKTSFRMNWISPEESQLDYLKRIAPARTFAFLQEIEALRARGLAMGGSLDNALVIDGENFVNQGGQRIENELASHKLLDAVGDFALAGRPIIGKISCRASGHALHLSTLKHAFENGCLQPGFLMNDGRVLVAYSGK